MNRRDFTALAALSAGSFLIGGPARAVEHTIGPVTKLPLPRYVSLKGAEGNARRGPGLSNRIDWVFTRRGMPLRITAEFEHWRRVEDKDGFGGWMHYMLLSGIRTVQFVQPMTGWHDRPNAKAPLDAKAQENVIARLFEARRHWVRVGADGSSGWVPKTSVWGVDPDEVFD